MKLTKSILRPVHATRKGGAASLSFLSSRLRRAGRASSFFTITGKKKGCAVENHEPSSPKVTCIGQVRVKSKKKVKQCRRRIGEVSFRKMELSNSGGHYHKWVHLPVCEALRAFRAEFCCFFVCKCCCFSRGREKAEKSGCYPDENGCGGVFARWLVAVNGGEGGRRREIEVVVGGGDEERMAVRSSRRHVFEDIEVKDDRIEVKGRSLDARVSICIPPKDALLLMRCRSDPMKMAALANRFSSDSPKYEYGDIEEENDFGETADFKREEEVRGLSESSKHKIFVTEALEHNTVAEAKANSEMEAGDHLDVEKICPENLIISNGEKEQETKTNKEEFVEEEKEEIESNMSSFEALLDQENTEHLSESAESCERNEVTSLPENAAIQKEEKTEESITSDKDMQNQATAEVKSELEKTIQEAEKPKNQELMINNEEIKKQNESPALPECLLLMMCEPKLSMEVSKETWVRGADFIRLPPERPRKPAKAAVTGGGGGDHEQVKKRPSIEYKPKPRIPAPPPPPSKRSDHQPARSSCSLPAASMAAVNEQKQGNAGKCEPFALTRCKSEPMSTAAAKLIPESCSRRNNAGVKMEPHRQAALGVGAAGVGF